MPILYSVISRGSTVLTKYAECVGNFAEVTEQIITKISADNHKLTYSHGRYLIHYIHEDRISYLCITDDVSSRNIYLSFYIIISCVVGIRASPCLFVSIRSEETFHQFVWPTSCYGHSVRNEYRILTYSSLGNEALQWVSRGGRHLAGTRANRRT